ncbi:uncharacterized protein [Ptychodera flava]|uniref:uncharacterized protein n=1 Tax=Ptychodera flava TaxID=63121 RepID=UPI003969DE07
MAGSGGTVMDVATVMQPLTVGKAVGRKDIALSTELTRTSLTEKRDLKEKEQVTIETRHHKDETGGSTVMSRSEKQQMGSVTACSEELPSGPASSEISGGRVTHGRKKKQSGTVSSEAFQSGSVSAETSGGKAAVRSKEFSGRWSKKIINGHESQKPGQKFKGVRGLAFHNDKLLVCDRDNNIVHILNKDYTCEKELGSFSGQFANPFKPWSIVVSQDNLYFILDYSNVQIVVCDQNNKVIRIISLPTDSNPGA